VPLAPSAARLAVGAGIVLVTVACFAPVLRRDKTFTNWDDPGYVTEQPLVRSLAPDNLRRMFDPHTDVMLNYHPLTVLSLAIEQHFVGRESARPYAATNVALHAVNALLVLAFVARLPGVAFPAAALTALWFGIHPMHVESVAWIPGRKDVLYALFFFASCLAYVRYVGTGRPGWLAASFALFALSCLSKAMAVPLPLVLFLLDWVYRRRAGVRLVLEKLPFLALALWIGAVATRLQAKSFPMTELGLVTAPQRIVFAAYGFVMYWVKLVAPYGLSAFYPYPSGQGLPLGYLAMPLLALAIVAVPIYVGWRHGAFRLAVFGVGFFVLTIALVLQIVAVGTAVMADRYSYVASVGALVLLASAAVAAARARRVRPFVVAAVAAYSLALGVGCYRRVEVWTNSETLWTDVIAKYPFRLAEDGAGVRVVQPGVTVAYENRGNWYREHGDIARAVRDYEVLVRAGVAESGPYVNMGNVHGTRGDELVRQGRPDEARAEYVQALDMYSRALERGGNTFETYLNRGITHAAMGEHERAIEDFHAALAANPDAPGVGANLAYEELQLGRFDDCIADATASLATTPGNATALYLRGVAYARTGHAAEARADLERAVTLDARLGGAWYELSVLYRDAGDRRAALDAAQRARAAGHPVTDAYLDGLTHGG
jgi:tetratricopeptide (TPR) repeat protein